MYNFTFLHKFFEFLLLHHEPMHAPTDALHRFYRHLTVVQDANLTILINYLESTPNVTYLVVLRDAGHENEVSIACDVSSIPSVHVECPILY